MKEQEYKNTIDKIHYSDEFSAKMEKLLSSPEIEVTKNMKNENKNKNTNEVSGVDRIKVKKGKKALTVFAACACFCGVLGAGILFARDFSKKSEITEPADAVSSDDSLLGERFEMPFDFVGNNVECLYRKDDEGIYKTITLTDEQKEALQKEYESFDWVTSRLLEELCEESEDCLVFTINPTDDEAETEQFVIHHDDVCGYGYLTIYLSYAYDTTFDILKDSLT